MPSLVETPTQRTPVLTARIRRSFIRALAGAVLVLGAALPAAAASPTPLDGALGSSGEAALMPARTVAAPRVAVTTPGLDVSHWQGDIDWSKVANAGYAFTFLKATDDTDYVDPTFVANRAGARANGLEVGAYHFARPDASAGDARQEAIHFVDVANPQPGDLLPVLDIETSAGLDQAGVTRWARTWVATVKELTGVTPFVYTSPYGWAERTGDTPLLARDGAPLWVAHWGVSSPTLPADGWDGHGWTVWQHTSTGHVNGISGNVDLDRMAGTRLGVMTIRRLTLEVDGDAGRVTSEPAGLGCATTCSRSVDPDATVTLTAVPDADAYFSGWSGACTGTAPTCTIQMAGNRTVGARFVTDITPPTAAMATPSTVLGPLVVDFNEQVRGVTPANVILAPVGGERLPMLRTCYSGSGAVVACDATTVRTVTLRPAEPLVPGRDYEAVVNPDGSTPLVRDLVGNTAATTLVTFQAAPSVEQTSAAVTTSPSGAWTGVHEARASGGSFAVAGRADAAVRLRFHGTGVDWITVTGPNRGRAEIYVDGELLRSHDLYSVTRTFGVVVPIDGLTDGAHLLRIVATGRGRPVSTGSIVAVDRFDVID
jgi:GH25 family lysozyme M1 (1,4-beta-N-acetylmuramidase)